MVELLFVNSFEAMHRSLSRAYALAPLPNLACGRAPSDPHWPIEGNKGEGFEDPTPSFFTGAELVDFCVWLHSL